jgi:phenylacetate-CoA ligase
MRRLLARGSYFFKRPAVLRASAMVEAEARLPHDRAVQLQEKRLQSIVRHAATTVPFYQRYFADAHLRPEDISTLADLQILPIITKEQIRREPNAFISSVSDRVVHGSTGGSTGVPLRYVMSEQCYALGVALLFRGLSLGGYSLGDRLLVVGGGSLGSVHQSLKSRIQDVVSNVRHVSSYGLDRNKLTDVYHLLTRWRPEFLRGYASSLYVVAKFIEDSGLPRQFALRAIFSTSEVLSTGQRRVIQRVFGTKVFNNYGLNDSGLSAFECREHNGLHIDPERSVLEVVNEHGKAVVEGAGRVLGTSLHNYAMPFLRYDTGDLGRLEARECPCGIARPRLSDLVGRQTDYLKLNGFIIGSPQLTVLMGKYDVEFYQIVQLGPSSIRLSLVPGPTFTERDREVIRHSFVAHVGTIAIEFEVLSAAPIGLGTKHKFIVNEVCR